MTENTFLIVFFYLTDQSATTEKRSTVNVNKSILSRDKRLSVMILSFKQCLVSLSVTCSCAVRKSGKSGGPPVLPRPAGPRSG